MMMNLDSFPHFTRIDTPEGEVGVENGTASHVFSHPQHGRVTVYETPRRDFVAKHEPGEHASKTQYYRIDPEISIEASTLHLVEEGWELNEFDAELADQRIQDMIRNSNK